MATSNCTHSARQRYRIPISKWTPLRSPPARSVCGSRNTKSVCDATDHHAFDDAVCCSSSSSSRSPSVALTAYWQPPYSLHCHSSPLGSDSNCNCHSFWYHCHPSLSLSKSQGVLNAVVAAVVVVVVDVYLSLPEMPSVSVISVVIHSISRYQIHGFPSLLLSLRSTATISWQTYKECNRWSGRAWTQPYRSRMRNGVLSDYSKIKIVCHANQKITSQMR